MSPRAPADDRLAHDLIHRAWEYPLFDAIFQRRARRVPWGAEKPGGVAPFFSERPPLSLDETEEALLVATGAGISGTALADLPYTDWAGRDLTGNLLIQLVGRTYPSPCASHGMELFFTNDNGTYFVNTRGMPPTRLQNSRRPRIARPFWTSSGRLSSASPIGAWHSLRPRNCRGTAGT
jgi:hypothetical protein